MLEEGPEKKVLQTFGSLLKPESMASIDRSFLPLLEHLDCNASYQVQAPNGQVSTYSAAGALALLRTWREQGITFTGRKSLINLEEPERTLDARIKNIGHQARGTWNETTVEIGGKTVSQYLHEIAQALDKKIQQGDVEAEILVQRRAIQVAFDNLGKLGDKNDQSYDSSIESSPAYNFPDRNFNRLGSTQFKLQPRQPKEVEGVVK